MKDHALLEELVSSHIKAYEEGYNEVNKDWEIRFNLTCTSHHVELKEVKKWVAYLRLERMIKPKGGKDDEWEHMLIYNQAYKFKDAGERANPEAPWKAALYSDLIGRLIAGGLEYGELLKRVQNFTKENAGKPISEVAPKQSEIIVTDEMPKPLTDQDKAYLEWVKKNGEKV